MQMMAPKVADAALRMHGRVVLTCRFMALNRKSAEPAVFAFSGQEWSLKNRN